MEESYVADIQKEYSRIDSKWLNLHYKISVGLTIFAFVVECLIGWIVCNSSILNTTIPIYLLKFLIIPTGLNTLFILIDHNVINSESISQERKTYIISLLFVAICFVLFTVHVAFSELYFIFLIPCLLTMIYGDYKLTTITFIASTTSVIMSELFVKWDIDKVSIMDDVVRLGDFLIAIFILIAFWIISLVIIRFENEKNEAGIQKEIERQHLHKRLKTDELTGTYNRIAFRKAVKDMQEDEADNSYIFAIIDLDNFKKLNDTMGHLMGDHYLIEFGRILRENCLAAMSFRYGGDEFCILFKNYTIGAVVETCEKIQKDLKEVNNNNEIELSVTASIGVSYYSKGMLISKLIANADKALYEAKTLKNEICIFNEKTSNVKDVS